MPRTPGVWTGPVKASKRRKVNTVDPFYTGQKKKEREGKAILDMSKENEHIPKSLRQMMEWQQNQEELKQKKEALKIAAQAKKDKPTATVFLGDNAESSESESDYSDDENESEHTENVTQTNNTQNQNQNKKQSQQQQKLKQNNEKSSKQQKLNQNQNKRKAEESQGGGKRHKGEQGKKDTNKKEKKGEKKDESKVQEFWELNDHVKFGETADRPPTITSIPRRAIKTNVEYDAKKVAQERAREKAVQAYAASKKRKASNSGNKFFL